MHRSGLGDRCKKPDSALRGMMPFSRPLFRAERRTALSTERPTSRVAERDQADRRIRAGGNPKRQQTSGSVVVVLTETLSDQPATLVSLHDQTRQVMADTAGTTVVGPQRKRRHQRRFTAAEVAEIGERYQTGRSMNELARRYGVYRRTILHALQRNDIPIRHRVRAGVPPSRPPRLNHRPAPALTVPSATLSAARSC